MLLYFQQEEEKRVASEKRAAAELRKKEELERREREVCSMLQNHPIIIAVC